MSQYRVEVVGSDALADTVRVARVVPKTGHRQVTDVPLRQLGASASYESYGQALAEYVISDATPWRSDPRCACVDCEIYRAVGAGMIGDLERRVRELSEWPPPHLSDSEAATLAVSAPRQRTSQCPECGADVRGRTCLLCGEAEE
jgi:hypothetical protein